MVQKIKKEEIRVLKPKIQNSPPTASLNAAIQAKNTGNHENGGPKASTSPGNQKATSNKPRLFSSGDQGIPNFAAPKLVARRKPYTTLGIVRNKS